MRTLDARNIIDVPLPLVLSTRMIYGVKVREILLVSFVGIFGGDCEVVEEVGAICLLREHIVRSCFS